MIPTRRQAAKYLAKIFDLCIVTAVFVFTAIVLDPHTSGMTLAECMAIRIQLGSCLLFALLLGRLAQAIHSLWSVRLEKADQPPR